MDITKYRTALTVEDIKNGEQCQVGCPLNIDMPNYYNLMDAGRIEDAYLLLKSANPFPSLTGRVCFFPCEYACERGKLDTSIAIREVEYFLSDYIQTGPHKKPELALFKEGSLKGEQKESVAIIGSGPAGMAAAWDLAHFGYKVTIYEKEQVCGGMIHLGIPVFKILREVIDYEIDVLKQLGVTVKNNIEIGKDITIKQLRSEGVSAICIAVGADVGNKLRIPGEEGCDTLYESTELLKHVRMGSREKIGDEVLVIGGGNTAMDISRTCRRLGSKKVTVLCRESRETMPAYDYEINDAAREGVQFTYLLTPEKILRDKGKLTGLLCSRINPDTSATESEQVTLPADSIILSISQKPNLSLLDDDYSKVVSDKGLIRQEMEKGLVNLPDIFAAGDAITGPRSLVSALASGRRTAAHINRFIRQSGEKPLPSPSVRTITDAGIKHGFDILKRQKSHKKEPLQIKDNFDLLTEKFTREQATEEIDRCMRCNNSIDIDKNGCILCNYCVDICPVNCLTMITENNRIITHESDLKDGESGTAVMINDALCIRCGLCIKQCPPEVISFKCLDSPIKC